MQASVVAVITGASRGLGQALARRLLAGGAQLITVARSADDDLAKRAEESGVALQQLRADLSDPVDAQRAADHIAANLPQGAQRYVLINNAGTVEPISQANRLADAAAIAASFNLNVGSVMVLTAAFLRATKPLSADCRILNISSGAGRSPMSGWGVYCATKAALDMYSKVVQAEKHNARIVSLAPGVIDTAMQERIRGSNANDFPNLDRFVNMHEHGQLSSPDQVAANIIRFLEHDDFGAKVLDDIRNFA